jgi:poly(3-hydroxybutyrate) depolymerase
MHTLYPPGPRKRPVSFRKPAPIDMMRKSAALTVFATILLCACTKAPPAALPDITLDQDRIAVVGFSSGAAMAQQVHLAFSDHLIGAALLAGPPYQCAEGALETALSRCIKAEPDAPDASRLADRARERAGKEQLAPLEGLRGDRVLVLHGTADALVAEPVTQASFALYENLGRDAEMELEYDASGEFAHVFPTLEAGGDCAVTAPPYLGKCGIDVAGRMMQSLFGAPVTAAKTAAGTVSTFDQAPFAPAERDALLDDSGYLYLPPQCAEGKACGLLIVFHGCEQNAAAVGDTFVREAGFNRWADVYDVVLMYPQTRSSYLPLNPKACWDWWGYSGADYDTRDGVQLQWLANAVEKLGARLK